jgi:hypothetical protein
MTNKFLEKIAKGEVIDMGLDSSGKLSKVLGVGNPGHPVSLTSYIPGGVRDITPMSLGRKIGIGAGAIGAGALLGKAIHSRSNTKDSSQTKKASLSTDNPYLDKIADFNQMSAKANRISGAPLPPGGKRTWFSADPAARFKAKPLSQGASQIKDHLASTGESLQSRLKANVESVASKASSGGNLGGKILSRIGGFIEKNPLLSAGGALVGGMMLGRKSSQSQQSSYQGYM